MYDWRELVLKSESDLSLMDLAEVHQACAVGLPGTEGIAENKWKEFVTYCTSVVRKFTESLEQTYYLYPERFDYSPARFRMLCLVTALQRDVGITRTSKLNDNPDFSDSDDLFIHGLARGMPGSCSNLPVIYAAVGRRLGYPLKLVRTTIHMFCRWEEPNGERLNVECTTRGLNTPDDSYYLLWPEVADPKAAQAGQWLVSRSYKEEVAEFLIQRAGCLSDNNRHREAVEASFAACVSAPKNGLHRDTMWQMLQRWRTSLWNLPARGQKRFDAGFNFSDLSSTACKSVDNLVAIQRLENLFWGPKNDVVWRHYVDCNSENVRSSVWLSTGNFDFVGGK